MAMQWVILVSIISLVLSVAMGDDKKSNEEIALAFKCCKAMSLLPSVFVKDPPECKQEEESATQESGDESAKKCQMVRCILNSKKLLNEDQTVNETELRKLFLEKENLEARSILNAALDYCFTHPNVEDVETCSLGQVFACIMKQAVINCPKTLWDETRPGCEGTP